MTDSDTYSKRKRKNHEKKSNRLREWTIEIKRELDLQRNKDIKTQEEEKEKQKIIRNMYIEEIQK